MSANRRQAYRYAVASPDAMAILRTSEGEIEVRIVNQSANGFGVEAERLLGIHIGEIAGFTTSAGQSIVRVIRVEFDDEEHRTAVGLQRVSEVASEPADGANPGLLAKWLGRNAGTMGILLAFGLGMGLAMGFIRTGWFGEKPATTASQAPAAFPKEPGKRAAMLAQVFSNLDDLKSRQFIKMLGLTGGQQRKIDTIVDKLSSDLGKVSVGRGERSPESSSHVGLMMIRRAWLQVEGTLTEDQMAKWDAILDGKAPSPGDQAKL